MARRQNEPFDEEVLRMIASRMNSVPALEDSAMGVAADSEASDAERPAPEKPRRRAGKSSYAEIFLSPMVVQRRTAVYVSEQVRDAISTIVRHLGPSGELSVSGYVETYCDIIWRSTGRRSIRAIKPRHGISCYKSHERYSFHVSGPRYGLSLFG